MPCFHPLQASFQVGVDGKKDISFSTALAKRFYEHGVPVSSSSSSLSLPCGSCIGCRLEQSRQTALRCVHESRMHEHNCFITLTYNDESLIKHCRKTSAGFSLERFHVQNFMKRLRQAFGSGISFSSSFRFQASKVVAFGCGEYGSINLRPHYHFCLFGCNFFDRQLVGVRDGFKHYRSKVLESLWKFGFSTVCDFSYETAAYVARYCLKKVKGLAAPQYYQGRTPEFSIYPVRPALGRTWFEKYGKSDLLPHDSCVSRGHECKVPRYYDKLWERQDSVSFAAAKQQRVESAILKADDNTIDRLKSKEVCLQASINSKSRSL